jgi:guanylate kinase
MELSEQLKTKVASYKPDPEKLASIRNAPMLFLVGIAGAGKNALLARLLEKYPNRYRFIVSHTTRAPRKNDGVMEQEGVHYHFIDLATLEQMIDNKDFIEVQVVHDPKVYGTSIAEVSKIEHEGKIGVSDIDIQGADAYVAMGLNVRPVFVLPPSFEEWMRRFTGRYGGDVPEEEMTSRLRSAVREFKHALGVDHFYIVTNDDLEKTVGVVHEIAQGEPVDPHYQKAVDVAEGMLDQLRAELAKRA